MNALSLPSFSRRYGLMMFGVSALLIIITCATILRSPLFSKNPPVVAAGAIFDLCITTPLLYYLFVVRSGRARLRSITAVFMACFVVARLIVPASGRTLLLDLRLLTIPLEVVLVIFVVRRASRAMRARHSEGSGDPALAIRRAVGELTGDFQRAGDILASEIAIFYYAFSGWRKKATDSNAAHFTSYKRAGWGTIFAALVLMIGTETGGVHLLVQLWSRPAAWVITVLDIYSIVWLLGDYQGLRLRPTVAGEVALRIRLGLRWSLEVPYAAIEFVGPATADLESKPPGYLKLSLLEAPQFVIHLLEPITAEGIFGIRRTIRRVGMLVDEPGEFRRTLQERGVRFGSEPHPNVRSATG